MERLEKKIDELAEVCNETRLETRANSVVLKEHARRSEASEARITFVERWMLRGLVTLTVLLLGNIIRLSVFS